ncbi:hypothetical protein KC723_03195 [Candidatus Kaiserbacteria bacterium]|nr:hypothetical protein [Candidatus Kaiserbacteria bacterium]
MLTYVYYLIYSKLAYTLIYTISAGEIVHQGVPFMNFNKNLLWAAIAGAVISSVGLNAVGITTSPSKADKAAVTAIRAVPNCVDKATKDEAKLAEFLGDKSKISQQRSVTSNRWYVNTGNQTVDNAVVAQCVNDIIAKHLL